MEKLVMLVKFLLVAVYIISECDCNMLSLDKAMCNDYHKAVVYAMVDHVEHSDANGNIIYRMLKEAIFKEGDNVLNVSYNNSFTMTFPSNEMLCGHTFPEDITADYIIAGDVGSDGILSSDMCQYARPIREVFLESGTQNLLFGHRKPSCRRGDS